MKISPLQPQKSFLPDSVNVNGALKAPEYPAYVTD